MDRSADLVEKKLTKLDYGRGVVGNDKTFSLEQQPKNEGERKKDKGSARVEGGASAERFPGFIATHELQPVEGEPAEVSELYYSFRETGNKVALYKLIEIKVNNLKSKTKDGAALTEDELKQVLDLIEWCPGGKEVGKEQLTEVIKQAAADKFGNDLLSQDEKTKSRAVNEAGDFWDLLRMKTLIDKGVVSPKNSGVLRSLEKAIDKKMKDNERLGDIFEFYNFLMAHEIDPQTLRLSDLLRDNLLKNKGAGVYRSLVFQENARDKMAGLQKRERQGVKEDINTEVWGVDPREYWRKKLLGVVEDRLKAMRAPTVTRLAKNGRRMEIVQTLTDKLLRRGRLASRLSFESLAPESTLGSFLNEYGRLDFWRGKAAIDRMWSLYIGVPIESASVRSARAPGEGLFSVLTKENVYAAEIGECCGPEAELQISKDDKVCDALNILYHLAEGKTYQQSLEELKVFFKKKYNEDIDFNNLPVEVKDAVMIAYFYALDIRANGNKDARFKSWLVGEFENLGSVTDVSGREYNLLGPAFALKSDDMMERGWFSGRNASLAFNAITGKPEIYDPNQPEHRRLKWQEVFFYTLGLDRDNQRVRHYQIDRSVPDDQNILPGTYGMFESFNNNNADHRRAVFDRLNQVREADRNELKPSWDDDLRGRVDRVLNFFRANGQIIFDPATMTGSVIWNDLNLVLEDPRAWGLIGDFRDSEMQERTQTTRYTMHNSLMYDCTAVESAGMIVELLKKAPNTLVEEFDTFPAQIMDVALKMKQRYHSELVFRNLHTLLDTAAQLAIERFLQVQIPSRDMIQKMLSEYKLFEWRRIYDGVKGLSQNGQIVERSAGTEFFLRQIEEELNVTEKGLVARFDDAIKLMVDILVTTESFDWGTERNLFMEKRAFVYQYMSSWLNPFRPVEGYKVPVVIKMKDGSRKLRELCVQDLTYREVFGWKKSDTDYHKYAPDPKKPEENVESPTGRDFDEFFTPMSTSESGEVFGGATKVQVINSVSGIAAGSEGFLVGAEGNQAIVQVVDSDNKPGLLYVDPDNLKQIDHSVKGWQRPGEIMLEGMRFVLETPRGKDNKPIAGQPQVWVVKKGEWKFERQAGGMFRFYESSDGYSRIWDEMKSGFKNPHEAWINRAVVNENEKEETVKMVHMPCLEMNEEQADRFFLHRYGILFRLLTGRAEGGTTPGQAILELDPYYEKPTAFISDLIRSVKELELSVNLVQQKAALRGMVMKDENLSYEFILQSMWSKDVYAIAKQKEIEGNIGHGQLKQVIDAADAIRDHEIKTLDGGWWARAAIWLNKVAVFPLGKIPVNIPAAIATGLELVVANSVVTQLVGSTVFGLISGAATSLGMPTILAITAPWFVAVPIAYWASLTLWDKGIMLRIIRNIAKKEAPKFGDYFIKYLDPQKNKEDAFFPAQ